MTDPQPARPQPPTLLIVDDCPENLLILEVLLAPHYRLRTASNGVQALALAAASPQPDLILLDVRMPEMDGHAVLANLRQAPHQRDTPVIVISALDGDEDEERAFALGAVDFIVKPFRPSIVLARVRTQLELRQSRTRLLNYSVELEAEVGRRTAQLAAAMKDLEGFTYAAAHDLKGPLGRINSFCSLLGQRYRSCLEGDGHLFLDLIQQNARRLQILVDDLLAHARLGQAPLPLQPIDVDGIIRAVLDERAPDLQAGGVEVRIDLAARLEVCGNPLGLAQVLRNLVDNALKYSVSARPPVVEIGGRVEEDTCRLWVRDNGIGIDPVYHEKIFEMFRRLHTYAEYPGSGVGLTLVRRATECMGGRVWVDSQPGQGATFFLELQISEASRSVGQEEPVGGSG